MSALHALIRACKAEPDDDAPRLILADWLEEHGEGERAAFIRRQIAEPNLSAEQLPPNREWFGEWERWYKQNSFYWNPLHFSRGFVRINDGYRELYDNLERILNPPFDWTWIESINFGSWHDGDWTPLFKSPRLLELNSMSFSDDHYHSRLVEPLSKSPFLQSLRHLRFLMLYDGDQGFRSISENPGLNSLRHLEYLDTAIGRRGARAFATSGVWDDLKTCAFRTNHFTDAALAEFTMGRIKPNLEVLDISYGKYTDAGLVKLSRSELFPNLRELHIGYQIMRDEESPVVFGPFGIESLMASTRLRFERLIVSIFGDTPPPRELERVAENVPDRIVLRHMAPTEHPRTWKIIVPSSSSKSFV